MSTLLQISDPHFGNEQAPVVEALVALARAERPDLVVLSGDITQRARPRQFQAARAFVDRLGAPCLAIPGNHDIPLFDLASRVFTPYARFSKVFGNELEPEHESADLLVLCVNTTRPWRHKDGEVSAAQIERVAQRLERARTEQLRVVVVHQPIEVLRREDRHDRLHGHAAAQKAWAAAGADLVMGGHIHLTFAAPLPGLAREMWVVQAGTAVSSRVRDGQPNSVNLLRWNGSAAAEGWSIERWDFAAARQAFECVERKRARLGVSSIGRSAARG